MRFYRKNKRLIKWSVVLLSPIILLLGIKGFIWYSTKIAIERYTEKFSDFVQISYKSLDNSLLGSASVHGITLFIPLFKETIHLKSFKLQAKNVIDLITLQTKLEKNQLPNNLSISLNGLREPLNAKWFKSNIERKQTYVEQFTTLACGDVKRFEGDILKQMGYRDLNLDINLNYQYDSLKKVLKISLYNSLQDFYTIEINTQINKLSSIGTDPLMTAVMMPNSQTSPKPGLVSLKIVDELFGVRKNAFCATKNHSTKQEYIDKHLKLTQNFLSQLGIKLDNSLFQAYRLMLEKPGDIELKLDLSQISNWFQLLTLSPNNIIKQLNTQLLVNGKNFKPLLVSIDSRRFSTQLKSPDQKIKVKDTNIKPKIIQKYHRISKNELSQYEKYPVKIKSKKGRVYKGKLMIIDKYHYEIMVRKRSGQLGYPIAKEDILSAEVFY